MFGRSGFVADGGCGDILHGICRGTGGVGRECVVRMRILNITTVMWRPSVSLRGTCSFLARSIGMRLRRTPLVSVPFGIYLHHTGEIREVNSRRSECGGGRLRGCGSHAAPVAGNLREHYQGMFNPRGAVGRDQHRRESAMSNRPDVGRSPGPLSLYTGHKGVATSVRNRRK